MKKKYTMILILVLLITLPANFAQGQQKFIPNAPFKAVDSKASDFSLKDLQGNAFKLSNYQGKPVLIFFGTSWCPSCRSELRGYKEIFNTYSKRGMEIAYINIMEPRAKVLKFAQANALPFKVILDEKGAVAESYSVIGVPTLVLIGRERNIIKIAHTAHDLPLQKLFPAN
jgi:peroxiredoxin